jgi:hypothetical protein
LTVRAPTAAPKAVRTAALFFKTISGRGQISRVDNGHGFSRGIQISQNCLQQLPVDLPQFDQVNSFPKLMEHFGIRQGSLVGQSGEVSPATILRQQLNEQITRMCRREQLQKLDAEQLRRTEAGMPALPWSAGEKVVDKTIIQVW